MKATNHVECPPKERHLRSALIRSHTVYFRVLGFWLIRYYWGFIIRSCLKVGRLLRGEAIRVLFFGWPRVVFSVFDGVYAVVAEIVAATSIARPRADVAYCIHALSRRLAKTRNWIVSATLSSMFIISFDVVLGWWVNCMHCGCSNGTILSCITRLQKWCLCLTVELIVYAYMFQDYVLFPWTVVWMTYCVDSDNISIVLLDAAILLIVWLMLCRRFL